MAIPAPALPDIDPAHFAGSGYVTVTSGVAAAGTQFRSVASGNWNAGSTWQVSTDGGSTWSASAGQYPGAYNQVYLQSGFTVTNTANAACGDLDLAYGVNATDTGSAGALLDVATYTVQLNGHLRAYYGAVVTAAGSTPLRPPTSAALPAAGAATSWKPLQKTSGSSGKIQIVGTSRALTTSTSWNATSLPYSGATAADLDVNLADASQIVTAANDGMITLEGKIGGK